MLLFNVNLWLIYSGIITAIIWSIFGLIDYFITGSKQADDIQINPIKTRTDIDKRPVLDKMDVVYDGIV